MSLTFGWWAIPTILVILSCLIRQNKQMKDGNLREAVMTLRSMLVAVALLLLTRILP
jgi:hypothetical protein